MYTNLKKKQKQCSIFKCTLSSSGYVIFAKKKEVCIYFVQEESKKSKFKVRDSEDKTWNNNNLFILPSAC
jgi:hypothetical protein